ncbi:MAG TPA: type II secretion system F family protein [Candidatus Hydrogenedentes bacterium]|nr:type II secretion system F family protein [Candidatus Hydrogenedentota bacterium]
MPLFSKQISTKTLVPMCRQLATSYEAGIPILRSLEIVGEQTPNHRVRTVLREMHDSLRAGATLADATQEQSKYLSPYLIQLLATGERGGRLDIMLRDLADYFEDRLKMQRQIVAAMALPIIYLCLGWFFLTFGFMILKATFQTMKRGGVSFSFQTFFRDYVLFQGKAVAVAAAVFAVCVILSRLGLFKWIVSAFSTHIWPFAPVTRRLSLARFMRSFSLLLGSGLRVDHCIESAADVAVNPYIRRELLKAVPLVKDGVALDKAFANTRYLTPTAREMIYMGEQSGNLEAMLRKASEYYLEEATHAVNIMTRFFFVGTLVGVLLFVGYFIIKFYLTLYGGIMDEFGI